MKPNLGRDTGALKHRASLNQSLARHNLEDWLFEAAAPRGAASVLDVGCGTGKQLFYLAEKLPAAEGLVGIDISQDAVDAVTERARAEGRANVSASRVDIDACVDALEGRRFDLIVSIYAIYYSKDMVKVIRSLARLLTPSGKLFIAGWGEGTNQEIVEIVNRFAAPDEAIARQTDFITPEQIEEAAGAYGSHRVQRLANVIDFPDAEAVMRWWRNHNMFRPSVADEVAGAVEAVVAEHGAFALSKNVLGVLYAP